LIGFESILIPSKVALLGLKTATNLRRDRLA
jgi:hypothetical protein